MKALSFPITVILGILVGITVFQITNRSGTPPPPFTAQAGCLGGSASCAQDSQCCSGHCQGGMCLPCAPPGTSCTFSGQCCIAYSCVNGICSAPACGNGVTESGEQCDGEACCSPSCTFTPSGAGCRPAAGVCDIADACSGSSATCSTDAKVAAGTVCRDTAGICDSAETCDGSSNACPADSFLSGNVCRSAVSMCDIQEKCDGSAASCPTDVFAPPSVVCRANAGICDVVENCTGSTNTCPNDDFKPSTAQCRPSLATCDPAENCPGNAVSCPADTNNCTSSGGSSPSSSSLSSSGGSAGGGATSSPASSSSAASFASPGSSASSGASTSSTSSICPSPLTYHLVADRPGAFMVQFRMALDPCLDFTSAQVSIPTHGMHQTATDLIFSVDLVATNGSMHQELDVTIDVTASCLGSAVPLQGTAVYFDAAGNALPPQENFIVDPICASSSAASSNNSSSATACDPYATTIIANSPVGEPNSNNNGDDVLGPPDGNSTNFNDDNGTHGFVTVGFDPALTIIDGPGNDIAIHIEDFYTGEPQESFFVLVRDNGTSFTNMGRFTQINTNPGQSEIRRVDLGDKGIATAKQVKILNDTVVLSHIFEGVDIDAIEALNYTCGSSSSMSSSSSSSSSNSSSDGNSSGGNSSGARSSGQSARSSVSGVCGNRRVEPGEDCDDGNTVNGDCCSATCRVEPNCMCILVDASSSARGGGGGGLNSESSRDRWVPIREGCTPMVGDSSDACLCPSGEVHDNGSMCKQTPWDCGVFNLDNVFDPVCGCDAKEYDNSCEAWNAGIKKFRKGICCGCLDTDGSDDIWVKGTMYKPGGIQYTDSCYNSTTVSELDCHSGRLTIPCPNGTSCIDGACK